MSENESYQQEQEQEKINPLLTIWLHPKRTARYVLEYKKFPFVISLLSIGYIGSLFQDILTWDCIRISPFGQSFYSPSFFPRSLA